MHQSEIRKYGVLMGEFVCTASPSSVLLLVHDSQPQCFTWLSMCSEFQQRLW